MKAPMSVPRKIHIVPVGFEVERVVRPIEYFAAEKVYLIIEKDKTDNSFMKSILEEFKGMGRLKVEVKTVAEFWDYEENMAMMCSLVYSEIHLRDNPVWINLSSGSKLHATIGLTVAQMFGFYRRRQMATPYYIKADDYRPRNDDNYSTRGSAIVPEITDVNMQDFVISPSIFPTRAPTLMELELIKKLKGSKGMRADEIKRDLYDDLEEEIKEGAKSARLVRLMSPSISGGLVETKGRTRSTKYKLTTKGESYLRSFEPLIELYKQKPKFE